MSNGPPKATKKTKKYTIHNENHIDKYYWLREKKNPEVISYLEEENNYTKAILKTTEEFQEQLYQEMKNRIKEDDVSAPEKKGSYLYYYKTFKGKQYKTYYRRNINEDGEEVLLDENTLAEGKEFFKLGFFKISPNQKYLAYATDTKGSEDFSIYIKNLENGQTTNTNVNNATYFFEWGSDSSTFYYAILSKIKQPYKVLRHKLHENDQPDEELYEEKDEKYYLKMSKSSDQKFIFIILSSMTTSEIHYLHVNDHKGNFSLFQERCKDLEYYVDHGTEEFFIRTNQDSSTNFKLMQTTKDATTKENWKEITPHRPDIMLSSIKAYKNFLVLFEREDGLKKIGIINRKTKETHYIKYPEPIYTVWQPYNLNPSLVSPDYSKNVLRFFYTSLISPNRVYDYNMGKRELRIAKQYEVVGEFDSSNYTTERITAVAPDNTNVYISLVYRKGITRDSSSPLLLYGYGSYGSSIEPTFQSFRLSLIDRGVIFAIAHIRGGGEMGRKWYDDGKLKKKMNTFTDFIACAEHLIEEGFTSRSQLTIQGGSAGGLLMGAVFNMRPDLFHAVIAQVPFIDVITTMLDASIPLTVMEYEEWGNPEDEDYYHYMKNYSPYDNIEPRDYPHLLITAGLNDPRVQYWEPAKWTAKLREIKTDDNILLLKTNMGAGHAGKSGRYDYLKDIALTYAFLFHALKQTKNF
jgi:oligopeptidase B